MCGVSEHALSPHSVYLHVLYINVVTSTAVCCQHGSSLPHSLVLKLLHVTRIVIVHLVYFQKTLVFTPTIVIV